MKIIIHLTFALATAKFGTKKSFLKHHHDITEKTGGTANSYVQAKQDDANTEMIQKDKLLHKSVGKNRQKLFLQHHQTKPSKKNIEEETSKNEEFDQLTWLLMKYKSIEAQFTQKHERHTYNHYFSKYLSKTFQKRY